MPKSALKAADDVSSGPKGSGLGYPDFGTLTADYAAGSRGW
jgi:hypothetical protein